jgi:hypothetical protein
VFGAWLLRWLPVLIIIRRSRPARGHCPLAGCRALGTAERAAATAAEPSGQIKV